MGLNKAVLIEIAGSQAELARALGITRGAVSQWGEFIPELQAFRLRERRPDFYAKALAKQEQKTGA